MVPPTLPKMWQYVLPRQLNKFMEDVHEMQNVKVPDNERVEEVISNMNTVVMVEIVPYILKFQLAIIVISVMPFGHLLIQGRI